MRMAMRALWGVDIEASTAGEETKRKHPEKVAEMVRKMDTYDLALLMVIAYRQHDPSDDYPDKDCICYGGEGPLNEMGRFKGSKFHSSRNFLLDSGIVRKLPDGVYKDVYNPHDVASYTNVYQLDKGRLMELQLSGPHPHGDEPEEVHNAEEVVHNAEADEVHNTDTKSRIDYKIKTNNNNRGVVVEGDRGKIDFYRKYIANSLDIDYKLIGEKSIRTKVLGKTPEQVIAEIDKHAEARGNGNDDDRLRSVGTLLNNLNDLPDDPVAGTLSEASLPALEKQFKKTEGTGKDAETKKFLHFWVGLVAELGLDAIAECKKELFAKYKEVLNKNWDILDAMTVRINEALLTRPDGSPVKNYATLREAIPDVNARAEKLKGVLADLTP